MTQPPPNSPQYSETRQQAPQSSLLRSLNPPPQVHPSRPIHLTSNLSASSPSKVIERVDSGYGTSDSGDSPVSTPCDSPDAPSSDGGHGLETNLRCLPKPVPPGNDPPPIIHRPVPRPHSPSRDKFESPAYNQAESSRNAKVSVVPPPAHSSGRPRPKDEDRIPQADPKYLTHKASFNGRPLPKLPVAVPQLPTPAPSTRPGIATGSYQTNPPHHPSASTDFPSSPPEPLITNGKKAPDRKPTNLQNRESSGDGVLPTPPIDDLSRPSSRSAQPAPLRSNELKPAAPLAQAQPAIHRGKSPFPTPPSSPCSPGEDEDFNPIMELYTADRTYQNSPSPLVMVTPRVTTPPQSIPAEAPADRQPPVPNYPSISVVDDSSSPSPHSSGAPLNDIGYFNRPSGAPTDQQAPVPDYPSFSVVDDVSPLHSFAASPDANVGYNRPPDFQPPPRPLTSLGLWRHLQKPVKGAAPQNAPQLPMPQEVPPELRTIFGLHCKAPSMHGPGGMQRKDSQPCYGAGSLEGVWKLADMMRYSSSSTPFSAFKQFPEGYLFSVAPEDHDPPCPLQKRFDGTGAILKDLADTPCSSLGVPGLLQRLNEVLGTKYQLNECLSSLLDCYVSRPDCDFGRAYGEIRRGWFCDVDRLQDRLERGARQDSEMRQKAIDPERGLIVQLRTPPRRVWDLYSNRVLPFWVLLSTDIPANVWAVSHSWVDIDQRKLVQTRVNGFEWPLPIPYDVELDHVRIELLNLGAEYVWLDVLCLRQQVEDKVYLQLGWNPDRWKRTEALRQEEWKLDVPTIGHVYRCKRSQVVIKYFSGLGRPFCVTSEMFSGERSWHNRVWTMQETSANWLLGGLRPEKYLIRKDHLDYPSIFHARICNLLNVLSQDPPDLFALAKALQNRRSTHDIDRVSALGLLLKCPALPMYDIERCCEEAWSQLVQQMSRKHLTDLLALCPVAGDVPGAKWRPSWSQLIQERGKAIPSSTPSVEYSEGELLDYFSVGESPTGLNVVYWNRAYVIENCKFTVGEGGIRMHALLGPLSQQQLAGDSYKTAPFLVETLGPPFDPKLNYSVVGMAGLECWVLGNIVDRRSGMDYVKFEKISAFRIPDARERERLWHLNPGYSDTSIRYL